jgi:endoplasmic reticulum junction formation protein lunapark
MAKHGCLRMEWDGWRSGVVSVQFLSPIQGGFGAKFTFLHRIYVIRAITAAYFNFRIESLSSRLKEQQNERAKTIKKLKDATKYDSTLELLEKYGGGEGKPARAKKQASGEDVGKSAQGKNVRQSLGGRGTPGRTNLPPPPTANIQREGMPFSAPGTPQGQMRPGHLPISPSGLEPSEEFAPNAFGRPPPPQFTQYDGPAAMPHWYDRIFDLILGEDETAPKNRIVLICKQCRLVNGQAPPGTESLAQIGTWKCMACGFLNGEMDEGKKIMREILDQQAKKSVLAPSDAGMSTGEDVGDVTEENDDESGELVEVGKDDAAGGESETSPPQPASGLKKRKGKGRQ